MIEVCEKLYTPGYSGVIDFGRDAFAYLELAWEGDETLEAAVGECIIGNCIDRAPGGFRYFRTIAVKQGVPGTWQRLLLPPHKSPYPDGYRPLPYPAEANGEIAPFRYVEILNAKTPVKLRRCAIFPQWDENASAFECDNAALNKVWDLCKYSMKATAAFGKFIDGERERVPYEGDTYINQLGYFCCQPDYSIAKATIEHFRHNPTWPTEWRLLTPLIARDYLRYSGDKESVASWLPFLDECLLSEQEDDSGFIGKKEKGDIVDWPPCERDGYLLRDRNCVPNCCRYAALSAMYELTGKTEYLSRAAALRQNLRAKFLRNNFWQDNLVDEHYSLHGAVFAQVSGATEFDEYAKINEFLLSRGMACSVYGAQFLLEAFGTLRNPQAMLDLMTATGKRSFTGMMEQGATITMEAWNNTVKPNQDWNHAWGASPANIIPRWIAGIRPCKAGFTEFVFDPQPGYLKEFFCRKPTLHGPVEVEWSDGRGIIDIPAGITAVFRNRKLDGGRHDFR